MIGKFFKPAWQSNQVEKRMGATLAADPDNLEQQQWLAELAENDSSEEVRVTAITKLKAVDLLCKISANDSGQLGREAAEQRLLALLGAQSELDEGQYSSLLERFPDLAARVVGICPFPDLRSKYLQVLNIAQQLDLLSSTPIAELRLAIVQNLTEVEHLEEARKAIKGRDKNSERIVKERLRDYRESQRQHSENIEALERLCEGMEYIARQQWRPEFSPRFQASLHQWESLDFEIPETFRERWQVAHDTAKEAYDLHRVAEETLDNQHGLVAGLKDLVSNLANLSFEDLVNGVEGFRQNVSRLQDHWEQMASRARPPLSLHGDYDQFVIAASSLLEFSGVLSTLNQETNSENNKKNEPTNSTQISRNVKLLKRSLETFHWQINLSEPIAIEQLRNLLTTMQKQEKAAQQERTEYIDQLHKRASKVMRLVRIGDLAAASRSYERLGKAVDKLDGSDIKSLRDRFEKAGELLTEMGDWKNFATDPKYVELCELMESLPHKKLHPEQLAKEIKALQTRWKQLGHSEISEQHWPRFEQAGAQAYQPCTDYYQQRRAERHSNLESREVYVKQMQELLENNDWDNQPDYKAIQIRARQINDDWSKIKDVEQGAGKAQWARFSKIRSLLYAKLDIAYDANIAVKRTLVEQADALAQEPAKEDNLAKLQQLQARWKQVGITRRKEDQECWTEFKVFGDRVYQNVNEVRKNQRAETDQQLDVYRKIARELEQLAKSPGDLASADKKYLELQSEFENNMPVPKQVPEKLAAAVEADVRRAMEKYDRTREKLVKKSEDNQLHALRERARICRAMEALPQIESSELEALNDQWEAVEIRDPLLLRRISERWQKAQSDMDRTEIGEQRRMLCIELEILAGLASPGQDKALRMTYQLQQMQQSGLGSQSVDKAEKLRQLELQWLCMPGAEPNLEAELDMRFQSVMKAI